MRWLTHHGGHFPVVGTRVVPIAGVGGTDTWEITLDAIVRILREHLSDELTRRGVPPIDESQIESDLLRLKTTDSVFILYVGDEPHAEDRQFVDGEIEFEVEITRFGPEKSAVAKECARTKAAVTRVLRAHMGLDDDAQTELAQGFQQVRIGRSEPLMSKTKTGFAHSLAFPVICAVRSSARPDGSPPDL